MWARQARDGSWYVLRWTNMLDACGEDEVEVHGLDKFECQVKRLDLPNLGRGPIASALASAGLRLNLSTGELVSSQGDVTEPPDAVLRLVECCIDAGLGAPLDTFTGNGHPLHVRGRARRYAMQCMRDAELLTERLERPVNAFMTSAQSYGAGVVFKADESEPLPEKTRAKLAFPGRGREVAWRDGRWQKRLKRGWADA
jgi:hypothetical protein